MGGGLLCAPPPPNPMHVCADTRIYYLQEKDLRCVYRYAASGNETASFFVYFILTLNVGVATLVWQFFEVRRQTVAKNCAFFAFSFICQL